MTSSRETDSNHIDYEVKVQDALRQIVRSVLIDTEKDGMKGDHHFYIAFKTQADGVDIPDHLRARFPEEMTIVLQHKFWGLAVEKDQFSVGLSFSGQPEKLTIPFDAIVGFVDPSVQFALQFRDSEIGEAPVEVPVETPVETPENMAEITTLVTDAATSATAGNSSGKTLDAADNTADSDQEAMGETSEDADTSLQATSKDPDQETADQSDGGSDATGDADNVVTLDRFRRKN